MIKIKNLNKTYKVQKNFGLKGLFNREYTEVQAIKDLSLEIKKGEFIALLGPNGAGKSTLIKMMIGVLAPSSGTIKTLGKTPIDHRKTIIKDIGLVFGQRNRIWPDLKVIESFKLMKAIYRVEDTEEQIEFERHIIKTLEIEDLLDRQAKKLSLGQKMRCELANTLIYRPKLLLLDEPTIGLDVVSKQNIRKLLRELHQEGITIILTSHDSADILNLVDRVVIIHHGRTFIDQPIKDFMRLNDTVEIEILFGENIKKSQLEEFEEIIKIQKLHRKSYEIEVKGSKKKSLLKKLINEFEIDDLHIKTKDLDDLLMEIYKDDEGEKK